MVFSPVSRGSFSHSVHLDVECQVAGTPGACSQVFCHPIGCIARTCQDRLAVSLIIRTINTSHEDATATVHLVHKGHDA